MADLSAFMTYGSADSTAFFNSRLKGIARGFFEFTGAPVDTVSGLLRVDVNPFRAVADDGMVVTLNTAERLIVFASETNHIVLRARRGTTVGGDTLELVVQTAAQFAAEPLPSIRMEIAEIVLGGVTEVTTEIDLTVMDKVETLSRLSWKENVANFAALPLPADPSDVRAGDVRIALAPLTLYGFDGASWISLATGEINTASNIGVSGVGFFDGKVGSDLQFKNIDAAVSGTITITDNPGSDTVEVDAIAATGVQRGTVVLANHLGGTAASPNVIGMGTTDGPTSLLIGAIADGESFIRTGATVVGALGVTADPPATSTQFALARYTDTSGRVIETSASHLANSGFLAIGTTTPATTKLHVTESGAVDNVIRLENTLSGTISNIFLDVSDSDALKIESDTHIGLIITGAGEALRATATEIIAFSPFNVRLENSLRLEWGAAAASGVSIVGDAIGGTLDISSSTGILALQSGANLVLDAGYDGPATDNILFRTFGGATIVGGFTGSSGDFTVSTGDVQLDGTSPVIEFTDASHRVLKNGAGIMIIDGQDGIQLDSEATLNLDAVTDITIDTTTGSITITGGAGASDTIGLIAGSADIELSTSSSVNIPTGNLFFEGTDQIIVFDSAVTSATIEHDSTQDSLIISGKGETISDVPGGLGVVSDVSGLSVNDYVNILENNSTFTGVRTNLSRWVLNSDIDVGGVQDFFVRAFAVEGGGSPSLQWSLDGEGNAVQAPFTGVHPIIYQSASAGVLIGDELLPGMIMESTGTIWNASTVENAWPIVQGSQTNNSKTVYGVLSSASSRFYEYKYWKDFGQALNQDSMCTSTTIAADFVWDGTTTILASDTSEVGIGMLIKFGEYAIETFKVTAVVTGVSITVSNIDSFTIPTGSGAAASYIHNSDVKEPVQLAPTSNSVYFKGMVNSVGEGKIWVTDFGGSVLNGDYISSSELVDENGRFGYGQKQADDILHSYTVAKCVESVTWASVVDTFVYNTVTYKRALVACTYHCG